MWCSQCHGPFNFDVIITERRGGLKTEGAPEGEGMVVIFGRVNSTAEIMIPDGKERGRERKGKGG